MTAQKKTKAPLEDVRIPVRVKLSLLWAATLFCYVYGDYFDLYRPGKLESMLAGQIGPLGAATQNVLLGTAVLMLIPSLMVTLTLMLRPPAARALNIVFGLLYSAVMVAAIQGAWRFYMLMGVVEIALTATIVWQAWRWPRLDPTRPAR